jgi:hypothetical protein
VSSRLGPVPLGHGPALTAPGRFFGVIGYSVHSSEKERMKRKAGRPGGGAATLEFPLWGKQKLK